MSPREMFGVAVRAIGVWYIAQGVAYLPMVWTAFDRYRNEQEFFYQLLSAVVSQSGMGLVVGCILFFAADGIVSLGYRRDAPVSEDDSEAAV